MLVRSLQSALAAALLAALPGVTPAQPSAPEQDESARLGHPSRARHIAPRPSDELTLAERSGELGEAITAEADIPANEIAIDALLTTVLPFDREARAFGAVSGEVCLLGLEDFTLRSRRSTNSGASFGAETVVANGVKRYAAARNADGRLWVALAVVDAGGGVGLAAAYSDDMCQTWTGPTSIVAQGAPSHDVRSVSIATGGTGVVAIVYRGNLGTDPYVAASVNNGATWTTPVRVDAGIPVRTFASASEDIAIDPATNAIHVVYSQDRGSGASVWHTRSTDGGLTFAPEQSLDGILPAQQTSLNPDVTVAQDGGVLVALWDSAGTDHIYVARSTNAGVSFATVLDEALGTAGPTLVPVVATAPGSSTMLLLYVDRVKRLVVRRSGNHGATYDAAQVLAVNALASTLGTREATRIGVVRTSSGRWAVGWSDARSDAYAGLRSDIFVRSSTDEGVTWGVEQRVDSTAAGTSASHVEALTTAGADGLFAVFQDRRNDTARSADLYAATSATASPLAFGADFRVDTDGGPISFDVNLDPVVASDGGSRVYVAFSVFATGPESDIYVTRSADGGYTFATPVRASAVPAGSQITVLPRLRAMSDGRVYLAYVTDAPGGQRQIRFNRSTDFGATWSPTDQLLGTVTSPEPGYYSFLDRPAVQLEALADGTVYVAWSTQNDVVLARSLDFGATFTAADIDQDGRGFNRAPRLCASGNNVLVVWEGATLSFAWTSTWAVASTNRGSSWLPSVQLRPEGLNGGVGQPALACASGGGALAVWTDFRSATRFELFANRFDGSTWLGDFQVAMPAVLDASLPIAAFADATNAVIAYEGSDGAIYASRSTNGGFSFPTFQRLDDTVAEPAALSLQPRIAADGAGRLWVSWLDESRGLASLLTRRSVDGGATWSTPGRLDRRNPAGGSESFFFPYEAATPATLPGAALFTWAAERNSFLADVLYNVDDIDDADRDGFLTAIDCNDQSPVVPGLPSLASGQLVTKVGAAARLSWTAPPPSDVTAIATGLLSTLRASGNYGGATCLADSLTGTTYDDVRANPPAGDAYYYLLRRENSCALGSFGNSTLAIDPRDALDSGAVCD